MKSARFLYPTFIVCTAVCGVLAVWGGMSAGWIAAASFAAVILASLLLSWCAEAAETMVSQGLAVAVVALLQVLPEFIVEAVIAWRGEVDLMMANATGSNRLLTGVGWPMVYVVAAIAHRVKRKAPLREIRLRPEHGIENFALILSSAYFVYVAVKGSLTLVDSCVLASMFALYFFLLARLPPEAAKEEVLLPPVQALVELRRAKIPAILAIFLFGGVVMVFVAHAFVDAMKDVAVMLGISTFTFVQWMAPFLSEFPEKVTAFYWAIRIDPAPMALLNLISSTVNQWTALMAMIPIVYSLGRGSAQEIPLDDMHVAEVVLSIAMITYGTATLLKRRFLWTNALILFTLWLVGFIFPTELPGGLDTRLTVSIAFAALALLEIALHWREIHVIQDLRIIGRLIGRPKKSAGENP